MTGSTPPALDMVIDVVVELCDPDEIHLFGSWVKGTVHPHSDVDLLVVGRFTASPWLRDREVLEALRDIPVTFDLHLVAPDELAAGAAKAHTYLATLSATSRCVYRRDGAAIIA